jgi:polyisoprenoid-binding protein YceI
LKHQIWVYNQCLTISDQAKGKKMKNFTLIILVLILANVLTGQEQQKKKRSFYTPDAELCVVRYFENSASTEAIYTTSFTNYIGRKNGSIAEFSHNDVYRYVVRFNLYDLGNVRIDEASLSTRVNSTGTAFTYQILDFNGDDFGEAYGTVWNNAENGSTFSSGLDYDTDNYYDGEDLLDALQEAVDGDGYIYFALICEDESTNNTQGEVALGGIELNIEATQRINYTITNSFGGGQIIVNGDNYNSGAVIPWIPGEDIVLESYDQTYQGDSYFSLNKWTNLTDNQVIDQNPWTTFFLYDVEIRAEYIKEIQITVATSFGSESIDIDGENHPSGSVFNWFSGEEHTFFATQSFIIDGQYYSFTGWSDCNGNAHSSNPLTLSFDDDCSLTAEYSITHAEKEVANHYNGNNIENSTLSVPGLQENIPSGSTVVLEIDRDYSIVTDEQIIIEPDVKHHNWQLLNNEYRLSYSFNLAEQEHDEIIAYFNEYRTAMLVPAHDDISYQIRDPWYVNSEGLQSNAFHDIAEVTQNNIYPSVFLEQGYENGIWTPPYYSVNVEEPVTIGTISGEKWAMEFNNWSESSGKATFQDADALETPVVFHADGAEIRANYDAYTRHLASETHLNADLSANRTVVYCEEKVPMFDPDDNPVSVGDYYYMIYQDGHRLYTTRSKDAVSWEPEELLVGNSDDPLYDFNPSIDFFNGRKGNAYANVSRLLVSYPLIVEDQNTYVIVIVVQEKDFLTDTWTEPMPVGGAIYLDNAGPVHVRTHASYAVTTQFRRRVIVEISDNNVNHIYSFISGNDNFSFQQSPGNILSGKNITYNNGHTNQDAFGITYFDNNGKLYYLYSDGETWHQSNQIKVSNPVYPHRMNLQNATLVLDEISGPNTISHIAWEVENLSFPSWHNKEVYYATVEGTTPANAIVTQKGKFSRIYNYENTLEPSLSIKAVGSDDVSVALGFARNPNKFVYLVQNLQESSRNWQHHTLGAGYRPVLGQQTDNMALWHLPHDEIFPFTTAVLPEDGGIAMKAVVRLDYKINPADNNNQEGIISIDLVEVQKNDEKVDIKKNLKSEPLTFSGSNEKLSYAMSIRFINISDNIDPNKVLLSIAAESDEGKIPLSNFKVSELQDASDEQIKSVIKKSRIDNIPLDAGVVVIEPGVMTLMDKSIVFMTDDEIDDILSKASVIEEAYENLIPTQFALDQNYPNPFNPFTTITYALPEQGNVELTVYNSLGQKVRTLVNKHQQAGYHSYIFNGNSVASGIYFYSLKTAKYQQTRKMLLIK